MEAHMKDDRVTERPLAVDRRRLFLGLPALAAGIAWPHGASAEAAPIVTHHRTKKIDGINIFYREAG
jgi:hypothetical protein